MKRKLKAATDDPTTSCSVSCTVPMMRCEEADVRRTGEVPRFPAIAEEHDMRYCGIGWELSASLRCCPYVELM